MAGGGQTDFEISLYYSYQNRVSNIFSLYRVTEVGSLSAWAKMATKIFVRRVFANFATNASFLRKIANLLI